MKTLLLDRSVWDLVLDAGGNIALASEPYAIAQDVASAIKLFLGELWYDTTKGIPYFEQILGQSPPIALVRAHVERAALTVPGVVSARCTVASFSDRVISGRVEFIDSTGEMRGVTF
jgi:hypothetical protein